MTQALSDTSSIAYDTIPYTSYPFAQTSPESMAAIARLFGLEAPDFRSCRMLELGCSSGGNILPLAELYPQCEFVGVDVSEKQLAFGNEQIRETGLQNVRLEHKSVADISADFGKFDYIVAHGLHSWVDTETQRHILRVCNENLSQNGVAYISYNTLPGWNAINTVRDMMMYHTRNITDPAQKTAQARSILNFMAEGLEGNDSAHARTLRDEVKLLADKEDYYLFHDHLEHYNNPVYFHEFMAQAAAEDLQYLGDTELQTMLIDNLPKKVAEKLREVKDIVQSEQYMDFFRNRRFRHTLLCHKDLELRRNLNAAALEQFHLSSDIKSEVPLDDEALKEGVNLTFKAVDGKLNVNTSSHLTKLVFKIIILRNGCPITVSELAEQVAALDPQLTKEKVVQHVLNELNAINLVFQGVLKLRLSAGAYKRELGERPTAMKTARYQAARGVVVTNGRHQPLKLQPAEAVVLRYLDGKHTLDDLVQELIDREKAGAITIHGEGAAKDAEGKRKLVENYCRDLLPRFAQLALLV